MVNITVFCGFGPVLATVYTDKGKFSRNRACHGEDVNMAIPSWGWGCCLRFLVYNKPILRSVTVP